MPRSCRTPPQSTGKALDKYAGVKNAKYAKYLAMIEWLDETCGELMGQLKNKGVADNTLVIYLADNGWNEYGKASPYENGVRTPVIAHWPAKFVPAQGRAWSCHESRRCADNSHGLRRHAPGINAWHQFARRQSGEKA